jgi:AraC-like DNA-binding protein
MSRSFADALRMVAADLRLACGVEVVWKDADPAWWARLPRAVSQHRNPHCLAVKGDRIRLGRCIGEDGLEAGDFADGEAYRVRSCPFGVCEVLVPIRAGGLYHGCCLVGPWRGTPAPAGLIATHARLPAFPGAARAAAIARVVATALAPLAAERTAALAAESAADDPLMAQACAWIEAHLDAGLRVRAVAQAVGLSPSRFVHRFATASRTPFGPYLRRRLMEEAARRLATGTQGVGAVAADLGFASHTRFSAAFRRQHGCTPSAFRSRRGA